MGSRIAARVRDAGYPLTVYNRTRKRAEALAGSQVTVANSPRDVAARSDVVITMLSDPRAVHMVLEGEDGILAGARPGLVYIDMSTVGPLDARATVEQAAAHGVRALNAPVLGTLGPAERGELIVLAGGDKDLVEAQRPLLETMGKTVNYIGSNEHACTAKLAVNIMVAGSVQLFGEAVALATHWGIPRERALEVIGSSPAVSPAVKARMSTMFAPDAPADFALRLARKDLFLATAAAYERDASLPMTLAAMQTFTLALRDYEHEDLGRIAKFIDEVSG
jgi:3-hydroxyisobutyrate dehydrogenase-like beta-hydroxyacid dehydrogenase